MIDLWIVDLDDFKVTDSTLSAEEKERAGRYHFDIHRNRFISRRSILRLILSKYLDCSPAAVKFKYSSLGKPSVDLKSTESIHFNVSHSRSKAVIAITSDEQVGVDIEFIDPEINSELISSHFFADSEIATIKSANAEEKPDTFFKFWTIQNQTLCNC